MGASGRIGQTQTCERTLPADRPAQGGARLFENDAKEQGISYRLFKVPMEAVLRAHTLSETRGFLKALVEAEGDRILGFTGFGVGAAEIMSAVQIAMIAGLPYTALRNAVQTHPTLVEGLIPLFSSAASTHNQAEAALAISIL
jgi:pyruvate/2-oxoglutarate dehydrogenase complex dihydrolipoamide dehydrogenase (E3) component